MRVRVRVSRADGHETRREVSPDTPASEKMDARPIVGSGCKVSSPLVAERRVVTLRVHAPDEKSSKWENGDDDAETGEREIYLGRRANAT